MRSPIVIAAFDRATEALGAGRHEDARAILDGIDRGKIGLDEEESSRWAEFWEAIHKAEREAIARFRADHAAKVKAAKRVPFASPPPIPPVEIPPRREPATFEEWCDAHEGEAITERELADVAQRYAERAVGLR